MFTWILFFILIAAGFALWKLKIQLPLAGWVGIGLFLVLLLGLSRILDRDASPLQTADFQRQVAVFSGEQLGKEIRGTLQGPGRVLIIQSSYVPPASTQGSILTSTRKGLRNVLEPAGYSLQNILLKPEDAQGDPYTDGLAIGLRTLEGLLTREGPSRGVVLLGLQLAVSPESIGNRPKLPPVFLATPGDPATTDFALTHGFVTAALVETPPAVENHVITPQRPVKFAETRYRVVTSAGR